MSPPSTASRADRLAAIKDIVRRGDLRNQAELCAELRRRGFEVTQSSISRDLRDLPVGKMGGVYRLTDDVNRAHPAETGPTLEEQVGGAIRRVTLAGANLVVVRTVVGGASRVGLVIDRQEWAEVVGTVAGDDTLFIAVTGAKERDRLRRRLQALVV